MAMVLNHILFTSDLTPGARRVFDHAVSLADKYGAEITIMHVIEEVPDSMKAAMGGILGADRIAELQQKHKTEAMTTLVGKSKELAIIRDGLEMFCQDAVADTPECKVQGPSQVVVVTGNVVEEVIRQAKESGCDLIVMGSHRMGRIAEMVLGSVVRGVLNKAEVPVFVVPLKEAY